jgi:type IV pilus assembly protein PilO
MPRIVTLNDIKIESAKDGRLNMDGVAKTYRYLDEAEIAAQKKPAAGKPAAGVAKGAKK